eukprot:scaffold119485_cov63-Phaeocystis_antarctica.AAC.1
MNSVIIKLLLVLPALAASGTARSRSETLELQRAYTEAERRCERTGHTAWSQSIPAQLERLPRACLAAPGGSLETLSAQPLPRLTLLLFDGGSSSSGGGTAVSRARASAEAVRFERGLRRRGEAGGGLLPRMGALVANLSNASLELALSSRSVLSAEPDCMVYSPRP